MLLCCFYGQKQIQKKSEQQFFSAVVDASLEKKTFAPYFYQKLPKSRQI